MKVLITGGAGFIGSHVVDCYIENGYEVVVVDNLSTGKFENVNKKAKFYNLDICNSGDILAVFRIEKPDVVNHHAAQMNVRHSVKDPTYDARVNIMGTLNLLECSKQLNVKKFIFASSGGAVYGEPIYLPCDEGHPVRPICPYGVSKSSAEQYLYAYKIMHELNYIVLRYGNVYGRRQNIKCEAGVVAIFAEQMLANKEVTINGDGEQRRDYIHVLDCAEANLLATKSEVSGLTFNIASGIPISVNQLFYTLSDMTDYKMVPYFAEAKKGETKDIYLLCNKARRILNWSPIFNLADGLADTINYLRTGEQK